MGGKNAQRLWAEAWALITAQYGVIARWQLLAIGMGTRSIEHRIEHGRLFRIFPGVYAVGRRELTREGWWMAAVLSCGPKAALSHQSGGALWEICAERGSEIHVSVPAPLAPRTARIVVHRRIGLEPEIERHRGIPVTSPALTLVDLAAALLLPDLERAIKEADKMDRIDPETLRKALVLMPRRPGRNRLARLLDRRTLVLTDTELERLFWPIAQRAGLPKPRTQHHLHGLRVDFYWPALRLVVETDGLRYHRTPSQQAADRRRDQILTAAGLTVVRFTHDQIRYEPAEVERTLRAVVARLSLTAHLSPASWG
jgi:very-short-patch-repair endonuclease